MKTKVYLLLTATILLSILNFYSCNRKQATPDGQPQALQEESTISEIVSYKGRGQADLVNDLFEELLEKRADVAAIVDEFELQGKHFSEEIDLLYKSDGKSQSYYSAAQQHIERIQDSIAREKVKAIVAQSEVNWKHSLLKRDVLATQLRENLSKQRDEMNALKIRLTLPQIEAYQKDKQPSLVAGTNLEKAQVDLLIKLKAMK